MKKTRKATSLLIATLLTLSLAACGGGASTPASNSTPGSGDVSPGSDEVYQITYAGTVPDSHPLMVAMTKAAEEMKEASGGRLVMTVYPNNQIGDSRANLEGMQDGTIQVGEVSVAPVSIFTESYLPLSLPFFFDSFDQALAWAAGDFAEDLAQKTSEECGFFPIAWPVSGARTVTNSVRPIVTPADMAGLKIRVMENDIFIKSFEAMGAAATPMSFAEVFTGLQQKTIDGQDNPLAINVTNAYYEVQGYWTDLNHSIDLAPVMVSSVWYEALPEDLQVMFGDYMNQAADETCEALLALETEYQEIMATGCEMTYLTTEQRAVFKDSCTPVYEWFAEQHPSLDLDSYLASLE